MVNAMMVDANKLIDLLSKKLEDEKLISPPEWSMFVKTGVSRERPPVQKNWWYLRAAAILRSVYKLGPIGTQKLRTKYGGKKNMGVKPERFKKSSGAVIRKILQQLEESQLIKQTQKGVHKGRIVTPKGKSLVDKLVVQIMKESKK